MRMRGRSGDFAEPRISPGFERLDVLAFRSEVSFESRFRISEQAARRPSFALDLADRLTNSTRFVKVGVHITADLDVVFCDVVFCEAISKEVQTNFFRVHKCLKRVDMTFQ